MSSLFSKPINISLTMAHDSLLIDHINKERTNLKDSEYIDRQEISGSLSEKSVTSIPFLWFLLLLADIITLMDWTVS